LASTVALVSSAFLLLPVCRAQIGVVGPASTVRRISLDSNGLQVSQYSAGGAITADGRFTAFISKAGLVPQDTNGLADAYLYDRASNTVELISVSLTGNGGNYESQGAMGVSSDGRFVAFGSYASNLSIEDHCFQCGDAFVRDRLLGVTHVASQSSTGLQGPYGTLLDTRMSSDGRYTVFGTSSPLVPTDTNGVSDIFVHDLITGVTERVSVSSTGAQANDGSSGLVAADISGDGNVATFACFATNLVPVDVNGKEDVFVHVRSTGVTELVSVSSAGQQGNGGSSYSVSSFDGRFIAFESSATNLVANDTNGVGDVIVRDRLAGTTERVSVDSAGAQGNAVSTYAQISPDGRFVTFSSAATNLVAGDTNSQIDSFLHDRLLHTTVRVSTSALGVQSNGYSYATGVARDARVLMISSAGSTLIVGDTNGVDDVFLRECSIPAVYCTAQVNSLGCVSAVHYSGVAQASVPQGFVIQASNVLNGKSGALIYSTLGSASNPFHGGTLCLQTPFRRTTPQLSGGSTSGLDCTGTFAYEFNALIASGSNPALVAGQQVWAQYWSRDPGFAPPQNSNLTDALSFVIDP
jgi:Tol biopolymer transport system component